MRLFSNSNLAWGTAASLFYFSVIQFNKFLNTLLSYCLLYSSRNIKRLNENSKVREGGNGFSISQLTVLSIAAFGSVRLCVRHFLKYQLMEVVVEELKRTSDDGLVRPLICSYPLPSVSPSSDLPSDLSTVKHTCASASVRPHKKLDLLLLLLN